MSKSSVARYHNMLWGVETSYSAMYGDHARLLL